MSRSRLNNSVERMQVLSVSLHQCYRYALGLHCADIRIKHMDDYFRRYGTYSNLYHVSRSN